MFWEEPPNIPPPMPEVSDDIPQPPSALTERLSEMSRQGPSRRERGIRAKQTHPLYEDADNPNWPTLSPEVCKSRPLVLSEKDRSIRQPSASNRIFSRAG